LERPEGHPGSGVTRYGLKWTEEEACMDKQAHPRAAIPEQGKPFMNQTIDVPPPASIDEIMGYHAHIYFRSPEERERAAVLRERIAERFSVQLGSWHDNLVGPHSLPMYQVAINDDVFPTFVPWLMLNRMGLIILVHPNTDRPRDDHLINALWLGERIPLMVDYMEESLKAAGRVRRPAIPNTHGTLPI